MSRLRVLIQCSLARRDVMAAATATSTIALGRARRRARRGGNGGVGGGARHGGGGGVGARARRTMSTTTSSSSSSSRRRDVDARWPDASSSSSLSSSSSSARVDVAAAGVSAALREASVDDDDAPPTTASMIAASPSPSALASATDPAELEQLINLLPPAIASALLAHAQKLELVEVVLDLGRVPLARFGGADVALSDAPLTHDDIARALSNVGDVGADNRAGIDRTLHRIRRVLLTLVLIRLRPRGARRSLRTFAGVSLRARHGFDPDAPRRLSTPSDAFDEPRPDIRSYGTNDPQRHAQPRGGHRRDDVPRRTRDRGRRGHDPRPAGVRPQRVASRETRRREDDGDSRDRARALRRVLSHTGSHTTALAW